MIIIQAAGLQSGKQTLMVNFEVNNLDNIKPSVLINCEKLILFSQKNVLRT